MSYRLETPRPRPPPPPIRTHSPAAKPPTPSNFTRSEDDPNTFVYEVSAAKASRAVSPSRATPPTSPFRPRSTARSRRLTPPPSRAINPSQPSQGDLEEFAGRCRAWYFDQNDNAGRLMTQTLATLPPSQRAPFARLQASIRSAYHASVAARRDAEFKAHLSTTKPGGSLMPHSRADPAGPLARKERYERLERFIRTWCTMGMPGTKPFFQSLWALMRLQVITDRLGGAGETRIEWEFDDAVFKEAAGKDFMLDAIDVLKGVLGFEEVPTSKRSSSPGSGRYSAFSPLSTIHSRSQSQPLPAEFSAPNQQKVPPIASAASMQRKRPRAPSDPFSDTPGLSTSYSSAATTAHMSTSGSTLAEEPPTPTTPGEGDELARMAVTPAGQDFSDADGHMRVWTAPDLPNPEYASLAALFPAFITQHSLPRFPITPRPSRPADIEEGEEADADSRRITFGTGSMWLGTKVRTSGWQGGWWMRFKLWIQRIFC